VNCWSVRIAILWSCRGSQEGLNIPKGKMYVWYIYDPFCASTPVFPLPPPPLARYDLLMDTHPARAGVLIDPAQQGSTTAKQKTGHRYKDGDPVCFYLQRNRARSSLAGESPPSGSLATPINLALKHIQPLTPVQRPKRSLRSSPGDYAVHRYQ
jgi:hypothetical protein